MSINVMKVYERNLLTVLRLYGYNEAVRTVKEWLKTKEIGQNTFNKLMEVIKNG
jgi:hypothetical protein